MVPTDQEEKWVRSSCIHRYFCINFLKVVDRTQIQYLFIINPQTAGRLDNYRTYIEPDSSCMFRSVEIQPLNPEISCSCSSLQDRRY